MKNKEGETIERNGIYLKKYVGETRASVDEDEGTDTSIESITSTPRGRIDMSSAGHIRGDGFVERRYPSRVRTVPCRFGFN